MGRSSKRSRKIQNHDTGSEDSDMENEMMLNADSGDGYDDDDHDDVEEDSEDDNEDEEQDDDDGEEELGNDQNNDEKDAQMEELEKEYMDLCHEEQDLLKNLKRHKDEDLLKGQAVKNQKALWDKTLEFRFLLQKAFLSSNRLPQEPNRSSFCSSANEVDEAYSDLIASSKKTLDAMLELQEAILEKNPSITRDMDGNSQKIDSLKTNTIDDEDEEWLHISRIQSRIAPFRDQSIDKWQRRTQVTTGAAAFKGKLKAFNQNISEQVAAYMRDSSKMIKGMRQSRSCVAIFGTIPDSTDMGNKEDRNEEGDPELLDDSDFYQQLLKEFLETFDPTSSETAFYALKRMRTKKRKIVDRRASKSRKIRYHVHEKIVNFMAPQPMNVPPMAPKLFENLFGLKTQKTPSFA